MHKLLDLNDKKVDLDILAFLVNLAIEPENQSMPTLKMEFSKNSLTAASQPQSSILKCGDC